MPGSSEARTRPISAANEVYAKLRERIIALDLTPGTVLSRVELARHYGVSQTPVRDALMRLEAERLVDVFPQHATVVSAIDMALARQAHFLRRSLELEIVGLLAGRHDPELIKQLESLIERQATDVKNGDLDQFSGADARMHACMFEAAGVPDLLTLVKSRSGHIDRLRRLHLMTPGKAQRIVEDHTRIVEAIAAGNGEKARAALRNHLSGTLGEAPEIQARFPAYFKDGILPDS